jgi:hypothetical protein
VLASTDDGGLVSARLADPLLASLVCFEQPLRLPPAVILLAKAHEAVRQALETYMTVEGYEFKSELLRNNYAAGRAEGEKAGEKEGIRKGLVLGIKRAFSTRGLVLSAEQLGRIESCLDEGQLETWLVRAWTAQAAVDLFDA